MAKLTEEATAQVLGTSKKKWALVLVAFLAGAVVVLRLQRRPEEKAFDAAPDAATPAPPDDAAPAETLRTKMQSSNQRVRDDLQRWAQLPMRRWQSRGDAGALPEQSTPAPPSEQSR
jgi:hypothetical protein